MIDLIAGANRPLPDGMLTVSLPGPFDLSALVVGANGKVSSDADFVFYNQQSAPGLRLRPGTLTVEPRQLRPGADRVVLVASPERDGTAFGRLPAPTVTVVAGNGQPLARFVPRRLSTETVVQLVEIYRRSGGWKLRALGQGYADGLGGLARDFGVDVAGDGHRAPVPAQPRTQRAYRHGDYRIDGPGDPGGRMLAEVVRLTNAERGRAGLATLTVDARLAAAAQAHSEHMATAGFFAHESPDGRQVADRVTATGYRYAKVAENIAAGQPSPAEVVTGRDGWMNSPGHRRNILDSDVTQIGVGKAEGGSLGVYWTQVFGRPRDW